MNESDSFETLDLSMIQPSDELSTSFEEGFSFTSTFSSSDLNGIPVDSDRWSGGDTYGFCVIA